MAINVRKLRPSELLRLLNSTPLGEVINERRLRAHRMRAGYRVGEDRTIDLLRYAAWLAWERHAAAEASAESASYEAHRERSRLRQAEQAKSARDIGQGLDAKPDVANSKRHERAARDFRFFCEQYFPQTFYLPWSNDHLKVIKLIELVVLEGGLFAVAMPRGTGKTSLCEGAALWALLYGHCAFVAIIGPDETHAIDRVDNLRTELEYNDSLLADFRPICFPIRKLEGINQRRLLDKSEPIRMEFTAKRIVLPMLNTKQREPHPGAGAVVATAGLTGQIRGLNLKRKDGSVIRPSLVLIDDPQTDESAHSPSQCAHRERIINGAILGLAGPGTKAAAILPCTVVRPDDLADQILDRDRNPQWQGERTKMVYEWAAHEELWRKYVELRKQAQREQRPPVDANAFYRRQRAKMDDGAVVAWPARHNPDELSALQHAWNIRADRGDEAFFAEYQNEPLPEERLGEELTAEQLATKVNNVPRGEIPIGCTCLTMFVDIQAKALYWLIAGWEENFTGYVIDYGTEPDQKTPYFTLRDVKRTLQRAAPRAGLEGSIYAGLERLAEATLGREWRRANGTAVRIDRCLVDANWGQSTDVVYQFCRQSKYAGILMPSHGRYVGAASRPMNEYTRKRGDRVGLNWRVPVMTTRRAVRHVVFDTNYWKSFAHTRFGVALGDPGCLSLFGAKAARHQLLSEHLTAEYRVKTEGRGRTVDEWKLRAEGVDNHWLDCLVGCAVAASMRGAVLFGTKGQPRARKRGSFAARQRAQLAKRRTWQ